MKVNLICNYCGHKWELTVWSTKSLKIRCPTCDDRNIKMIEDDGKGNDIFGYNYKPKHLESENEDE